MKVPNILVIVFCVCLSVVLFLHFNLNLNTASVAEKQTFDLEKLISALQLQNDTIVALYKKLKGYERIGEHEVTFRPSGAKQESSSATTSPNLLPDLKVSNNPQVVNNQILDPVCSDSRTQSVHLTSLEKSCNERYGFDLISKWSESKEVWCESNPKSASGELESTIICYPYVQHHKKNTNTRDMFCVAKNFFIDFSKVRNLLEC